MASDHQLPLGHDSSRRQLTSTNGSAYENGGHPVEEDILSRIRSLLLSRNSRRPPRAPNNSDETLPRCVVETGTPLGRGIDFAAAERATILARTRSERMSLPNLTHRQSQTPSLLSMDSGITPPAKLDTKKHGTLRSVSSTNDMKELSNDVHLADLGRAYLSDGPSSPPPASSSSKPAKNSFRFPRLVLKDKEPRNMLPVRSCMSSNGDDLACFIAGCTHPRLTPLEIAELREKRGHSRANSTNLENLTREQEDAVKHGAKISLTRVTTSPASGSVYSQEEAGQKLQLSASALEALDKPESSTRQTRVISAVSPGQTIPPVLVYETTGTRLDIPNMRSSRATSRQEFNEGPLIPKNEEPIELVQKSQSYLPPAPAPTQQNVPSYSKQQPPPDPAAKLVEGFPAIKTKVGSRANLNLAKQLEEAERSQVKSPSLLSNASKRTARHALLKPCVTPTSPVDNGLPVPPVLTQPNSVIMTDAQTEEHVVKFRDADREKKSDKPAEQTRASKGTKKILTVAVVDHLSSLQNARDAVLDVEEQLRALKSDSSINSEPGLVEQASSRVPNCPCFTAEQSGAGAQHPHANTQLNGDYWGFGPAVKDAVKTAVKDAVRNAVKDIRVPVERDITSRAYRRIVSDSIAEAAEEADIYLRRPSVWNEQAPEPDATNQVASPSSRENVTPAPRTASPNNMETIPLRTVEEALAENDKQYQRLSKLSRNGAGSKSTAVPDRISSRGRTPGAARTVASNAVGSVDSYEAREKAGQRGIALSSEAPVPEVDETNNSALNNSSGVKFDSNKTIHWLKDLLSSNGPYEPRFTALPPKAEKDDTGRDRSQTAPSKPADKLFLFEPLKPGPETVLDTTDTGNQAAVAETFTKTINDLELLLNEALFIARQAADREDPGYVPVLLGNAAAVLKGGRKGIEEDIVAIRAGTANPYRVTSNRRRDDVSVSGSIPSVHESLRSLSDSSDSYLSDEEEESEMMEYQTQVIPRSTSAREIQIVMDVGQKTHSPNWAPRRPTGYPHPSAEIGIVSPSVNSPEEIAPPRPRVMHDRVTADMDPFLTAARGNTDRRNSSHVSPGARSRGVTTSRSEQRKSVVVDDRAIPQNLRGPDPQPVSLPLDRQRGSSVSIVRMGNKAWIEANSQDIPSTERRPTHPDNLPSTREVREYIKEFHHPPILPRSSSLNLKNEAEVHLAQKQGQELVGSPLTGNTFAWQDIDPNLISCSQTQPKRVSITESLVRHQAPLSNYTASYDGVSASDALDFETGYGHKRQPTAPIINSRSGSRGIQLTDNPDPNLAVAKRSSTGATTKHPPSHLFSLNGKHHLSLRGSQHKGFSFSRSHKKPKIARDWAPARKRFVASVACISTALVGLLVGMYAASVPSIQYYIVDFHHYVILGNVFFYIGLAIPTFFFWPLPLLHGRKPYIMGAMCLAMPLLFPQALAVGDFRSPYSPVWRVALILPRSLMGFVLGFANMNFKSTLTDLFGASLQSANPHQEVVDESDVRRHGGGLGVWLGIWTWCSIGSIGLGFMFGAIIINNAPPAWGFYITIIVIAFVLLLNVICPEVRRSAFRRSVAEAKVGNDVSRRLGRGEVKMHMVQSGPKWWGQEFHYGLKLSMSMLRQPGFLVLALYVAWIYGQIVLIIVLLGSLMSKYYHLKSPLIGAAVAAVPIGALLSVPFQKAGLFSRERTHAQVSDDDTRDKKPGFSSHFLRRAIFVLCLPFAGLAYTLSSNGPPIPLALPIMFAALIAFLSNLALAECHGIIMETFDTSDLQPGMTGRPRKSNADKNSGKRTNYSSFPRVMSGFAIIQSFGYLIAACATGVGGVAERSLGAQAATGVMAGILLILSILLLLVLVRFRTVQIIPDMHKESMENYMKARRKSAAVRGDDLNDEDLRPTIIGNPTHTTRRMCILEMGSMTRWSEIRKKNHLVNQGTYEAKHPNMAVMRDVEARIVAAEQRMVRSAAASVKDAVRSLSPTPSKRSKRSFLSDGDEPLRESVGYQITNPVGLNEQLDLGGHRDMVSGNGLRNPSASRSRNPSRRQTGNRSSTRRSKRKSTIVEGRE